jgi:hypothetical protein
LLLSEIAADPDEPMEASTLPPRLFISLSLSRINPDTAGSAAPDWHGLSCRAQLNRTYKKVSSATSPVEERRLRLGSFLFFPSRNQPD